jgi:uncharacterized RDD family membrane protein YckC
MSDAPKDVRTAQTRAAALRRRREAPAATAPSNQRDIPAGGTYAGLVTRAIAFALDAAVVNGCALVVGVTVGLGLSILHLPSEADTIIAVILAGLAVIWLVAYFTFFWSTTGQTPGDRVMRIEVIDRAGRPLKPLRAAMRFGFLILAALPLLVGILIMLWDDRRRCLQDRLARTVVVYTPTLSPRAEAPQPSVIDTPMRDGR